MRRTLGSITVTGPGVFRVSASAGVDAVTGKRRRTTQTVRGTRKDAERALSVMLIDAGHGAAVATTGTVEEYLTHIWLPRKEQRVRRKTYEGYQSKVDTLIVPYIGHIPLKRLDNFTVSNWLLRLKSRVGPQSVNHARAVLKNAMRDAEAWGLVGKDPTFKTEKADVGYEPEVLDAEGVNVYLDAFAGHFLEPIVTLALAAGLRRSELAALQWSDIDFTHHAVRVTKGLHQSGGEVWVEPPKSKQSKREVVLPEWAADTLKSLRGVGSIGCMKPDELSRRYKEHVKASGLVYIPLKNLRHSSATVLLDAGVPLDAISKRLGHSDINITSSTYTRPHRVVDELAAKAMGEIRRVPANADERQVAKS